MPEHSNDWDRRRGIRRPTLTSTLGIAVLTPFALWGLQRLDGPVQRLVGGASLGGDLRRELETWQQFGGLGSLILTAVIVWLVAPSSRRLLPHLAAGALITSLMCLILKNLVGRPRPKFLDPDSFLWWFGVYPIKREGGNIDLCRAWQAGGADLWSMPSSHTAMAIVLGLFLGLVHPRLRWLGIFFMVLVGVCRIVFNAHWLTDVLGGAATGLVGWRLGLLLTVPRRKL